MTTFLISYAVASIAALGFLFCCGTASDRKAGAK